MLCHGRPRPACGGARKLTPLTLDEATRKTRRMRKQRDAMMLALMLAAIAMALLAARAYPPQADRASQAADPLRHPPVAETARRTAGGKQNVVSRDGAMAEGSPSSPKARPIARLLTRTMTVTAYCPCEICCGQDADGITASGLPVTANGGRFVAAPREIAFGVMIEIPGYGAGGPVPVLDRGGAITGDRLDVFFPTHREAIAWGVRTLTVQILYPPDPPADFDESAAADRVAG